MGGGGICVYGVGRVFNIKIFLYILLIYLFNLINLV
jgi:hypothetical protein